MKTITRRLWLAAILACLGSSTLEARIPLAQAGQAQLAIYTQPDATAPELRAAQELATTLRQITGATFELIPLQGAMPEKAILVGAGPKVQALFPEIPLASLGAEETVLYTKENRYLLLAGGRPRGTLYAVSRFLQDYGGVRWWTPWATTIPHRPNLSAPDLAVRQAPAFEARDPFWYVAFDGDWAMRNFSNSQSARLTEEQGGKLIYKGFVHTFYPLVPPEQHFAEHPEWYSLIDGKRTTDHAQLCLTNPQLRDFVVERVRQWLKESPEARIISVSQNDWRKPCQCPNCKALDDAEGTHAGSLLEFVNYVADKIGPDFPEVAIDTLAYQYTRKAPKNLKPRPNVIIRLCSIECNFAEPLEAPSNASFAQDIRDWSRISQRLYVWDYVTDFAHYVQPHPNWYALGPNVRFFHQHHVKGLFEQGAYQSHGAEMAEMRAWVLAQLMWNPYQDDRALIDEFLDGYYGRRAARFIRQYFDLMQEAARGYNLTCFSSTETPFLKFATLAQAEKLWQQAERATIADSERFWRVRQAHLPVRYAWLARWNKLQDEGRQFGGTWPLSQKKKAVAEEWLGLATGRGPDGWKPITHLNESGLTPDAFIARVLGTPPPAK